MANGLDFNQILIIMGILFGGVVATVITIIAGRHYLRIDKAQEKTEKSQDTATTTSFTVSMVQGDLEDYKQSTNKKIDDSTDNNNKRFEKLEEKLDMMIDKLYTHDKEIAVHREKIRTLNRLNKGINEKGDYDNNV